eukprot:scaffold1450_cov208-Prasinococcus_capsulatus_cf.AAC.2
MSGCAGGHGDGPHHARGGMERAGEVERGRPSLHARTILAFSSPLSDGTRNTGYGMCLSREHGTVNALDKGDRRR